MALRRGSQELGRQHVPVRAGAARRRAHPAALHAELRDRAERRRLRRLQLQLGLLPREPPAPLHRPDPASRSTRRRREPGHLRGRSRRAAANALDAALRRRYGADFEVVVANAADDGLDRLAAPRRRLRDGGGGDGADAHERARRRHVPRLRAPAAPDRPPDRDRRRGRRRLGRRVEPGAHVEQGRHVFRAAVGQPGRRASPGDRRGAAGVGPGTPASLREGGDRRHAGAARGPRLRTLARAEHGRNRARTAPIRSRGGTLLRSPRSRRSIACPVIELYDGRVLVDPADDELAEALGASTHPKRAHGTTWRSSAAGPRAWRQRCTRRRRAEHRADRAGSVGRPGGRRAR